MGCRDSNGTGHGGCAQRLNIGPHIQPVGVVFLVKEIFGTLVPGGTIWLVFETETWLGW